MDIAEAQRDVRTVFLGGSVGQLVTGLIWLGSAALSTWVSHRAGILFLVVGGTFIYPLTQVGLRLLRSPASLPKGHPMNALAMQVAFIVPACLPLVGAAALSHVAWFYPACLLVVGAHYMPFIFLYGMSEFGALAGLLMATGVASGMYLPSGFALPGWIGGSVLVVFASLLYQRHRSFGSSPAIVTR